MSEPLQSPRIWQDAWAESSAEGQACVCITLLLSIAGIRGVWRRCDAAFCKAYTLLSLLPVAIGPLSADWLPVAFRSETGHIRLQGLINLVGTGEVAMPLMVGAFYSCVLMVMASVLWARSRKDN